MRMRRGVGITGSFDLLVIAGQPFNGTIPSDVQIMLGNGELGDFMSGAVYWEVFHEPPRSLPVAPATPCNLQRAALSHGNG